MSLDIGFASQAPSLPGGGGGPTGLGETFTPDLSTGTGSMTIPLDTPNGPNDISPRLAVRYDSGAGNGPFGLGWSIPLPRILRSTMLGRPRYDDTDTLILEGSGPLVRTPDGILRPEVETGDWRIEAGGPGGVGFLVTDRSGTRYELGTSDDSRIPGLGGAPWAWLLHAIEDNLGQRAEVTWRVADAQRYLDTVDYGPYQIRFGYQPRPDPLRWGRGGFELATDDRCTTVELHLAGAVPNSSLIRRWSLAYDQAAPNGGSLLASVTLTGFAADGTSLSTPPVTLTYAEPGPATLQRIPCVDDGSPPPPLTSDGRVELVDWTGDGLPDVIAFSAGGTARVWPNLGGRWGRPVSAGLVAALAGPDSRAGLVDVDGDGMADVVRVDAPLAGFQPRSAEGFARPVSFSAAPSVSAAAPNSRLADLDGDGRVDMLWSTGDSLLIAGQVDDNGWQDTPFVVPASAGGPPTDLADPRVFCADMTGDGTPDLVRVDGGGVSYWPYLGYGVFGDRVTMADPPRLAFDTDPSRILLVDIDGDGCADVIQLDGDVVRWWPNRSGSGFQPAREIAHLPAGSLSEVRVADLLGTGAPQLCWSVLTGSGRGRWFALDLLGGVRCGLLTAVDNGAGRRTAIGWSTSAAHARRDIDAGRPWPTRLPIVLPVVESMVVTDAVGSAATTTTFSYHDGRYDGALREVCGFGQVDQLDAGDSNVAALQTIRWYHIGLTAGGAEPDTVDERRRFRAIRGRCYREDRCATESPAGSVLGRTEQDWQIVDVTAGLTVAGRLTRSTRSVLEGAADPVSRIVTEQLAFDADGNVTSARESSFDGSSATPTGVLNTATEFAADPAHRFRQRIARISQTDGAGTLLADTRTAYDGLPFGTVGATGLVTQRLALAITDAAATDLYGAEMPDLAALGYQRVAGSDGWWIRLGTYSRTVTAGIVQGSVTGPLGGTATLTFDPTGCYPIESTDAVGNRLSCEFDLRSYQPTALLDPSGSRSTATFDALARIVGVVLPGDSGAAPTIGYAYRTDTLPAEVTVSRATATGSPPTVARDILDGDGRLLQRRFTDDDGEVIEVDNVYGARGLLVRIHLESRPAAAGYGIPAADTPHTELTYDALGRLVRTVRPDASTSSVVYGPGRITETDEAGHVIVRHLDATGRVVRTEQPVGATTAVSTDTFDVKGNLTEHVDAAGVSTRFGYDLLGRTLRIQRPEATQVAVLDAAGNTVESRNGAARVYRSFDLANRPTAVRHDTAGSPPVTSFTYQDNGSAPPADAGAHTDGGRLVRVDDAGGALVLDYDERGRLASKTMTPTGSPTVQLRLDHGSDDQIRAITYPGGVVVDYDYDRAGRLRSVAGVIDAIDYDLAGRRTRTAYANGTVATGDFDDATGRRTAATLVGPGGVLRQVGYTYDAIGNITAIASPDAGLAWQYTYDDLSRLTGAVGQAGGSSYAYDLAGNLTNSSDLGGYVYGGGGAATTCLTTAGPDTYSYDDRGHLANAPWGRHTVDAEGRLTRIVLTAGGVDEFVYGHGGGLVLRRHTDAGGTTHETATPDQLLWIEDGQLVLQITDGERVVARDRAGTRNWLHVDHLGSLVLVTDQAGAVVQRMTYGPYGQVLAGDPSQQPQGFGTGEAAGPALVLLGARWYCPRIGRFLSPDPVIGDAADPLAWNVYAYCRGNPTSYLDPSGRSFWKIFGAVLATIAIVALVVVVSVFTFGIASPGAIALGIGGISVTWGAVFAATLVGVVAGGVIGGIAAARAGGDAGDIFLGIVVGGAVGGWAAFGAAFAGVAVAGGLGLSAGSIGAGAVAGGVSGAINGAAMGFASGFAGGKNNGFKDIMEKVLVGAIVGAAIGAALGALSGLAAPKGTPKEAVEKALTPQTPSAPNPALPPGAPTGLTPPPTANSVGGALGTVGQGLATKAGGALLPFGVAAIRGGLSSIFVQTIAVDLSSAGVSAFWDDLQEYVRTHNVNLGPFNFIKGDW